ncbi:MAG: SRPBCC family protein [Myxococcota bacterium]|jgi:hypothetical protein|nr:SRPBCC family protein [Myxococcota bacterium]
MTGVTRSIEIQAPIDTVYGVITDYERYPEFLDHMTAAKVLRRADGVTTVGFELDLIKVFHYEIPVPRGSMTRLAGTSLPRSLDAFRRRAQALANP